MAERGAEGGGESAVQELGADKAGQGETVRGRDSLHLHEDGRAAEGEQERNEHEKCVFWEK